MINKLIFSFLFSIICSVFASASSVVSTSSSTIDTAAQANALPHVDTHTLATVAHDAHTKTFDPVEIIMHHVSDANEFHILGHTSLPLPVIIYNKDKKNWFTVMSSVFHAHHGEGTVEADGYKMEHSRVHPIDGSHIIDFSIRIDNF